MSYAKTPAYAQTGFFRALVTEVLRRWPGLETPDMVRILSLDTRRHAMMALQDGAPLEARKFADSVLGIHHWIDPNVGYFTPQPALVGQGRYDYTVFKRALDGIEPWSQANMDQAILDGWIISSQDDGTEQIQKYDEDPSGLFDTDEEAQAYVDKQAAMSLNNDCIYNRAIRYVAHSHGNL